MNAASDRTGKAGINERICSRTEDISMNGRLDLRLGARDVPEPNIVDPALEGAAG